MAIYERNDRAKLLSIYREWQAEHISRYARWAYALTGLSVAIAIPFDFMFFGDYAQVYLGWRLGLIAAVLALTGVQIAAARTKFDPEFKLRLMSALFTLPIIGFNVAYAGFLYMAPDGKSEMVLAANYFFIALSAALSHRFFSEQYRINFSLAVVFAIAAVAEPRFFESGMQLVLANLTVMLLAFALRREFVSGLFEKYKNVRVLAPEAVARHLAVFEGDLGQATDFLPRERYTVCVMSDWRNYQQLAAKETAAVISELFRTYYELVYERLEKTVGGIEYYASWNADELCVVFFGDEEDQDAIDAEAMTFVGDLTGEIYDEIGRKFDRRLKYDVGVSAGISLVGLLGPRQSLKTTLIGSVPGIAKRLEQHAKQLRTERLTKGEEVSRPLIAIVRPLAKAAMATKVLSTYAWYETTASVKDINGQTVVVLDASPPPAAANPVESEALQTPIAAA